MCYNHTMKKSLPTALVAVDICIFRIIDQELCVYVSKVKSESVYKGMNCLPGSLIHIDENAEDTLQRVLNDRTNLKPSEVYVKQLAAFSDIQRDVRSRSVAIAYYGLMDVDTIHIGDDVDKGHFVPVSTLKHIAFDHKEIIEVAIERLRNKVTYSSVVKKLLHKDFTFSELQNAHEIILGKDLDKRNFRKKINGLDLIKETKRYKKEGRMRPAMLYVWKSQKIERYDVLGFTK